MIIQIPENYSSAYSGALYHLRELHAAPCVDVEVIDTDAGETLGIRRVRHLEEAVLNITGYLTRALNPRPLPHDALGWVEPVGRDVGVCLACGDLLTDPCRFVASLEGLQVGTLLSDLRRRTLARGERDELSFLLPACHVEAHALPAGGAQGRVVVAAADHGGGLLSLAIDGSTLLHQLPEGSGAIELEIVVDGRPLTSLHYLLGVELHDGLRLGWLNRYGAIDYFTFRSLQRHLVSDKERVLTPSGALVVSSQATVEHSISSGYLSCRDAEVVAGVLSSPRLWLIDGSEAIPHEVTNQRIEMSSHDHLCELHFTLRASHPTPYQTF